MNFGLLLEMQYPRPWTEDGELTLFQQALEHVELADKLGYSYAWEVEHHFLEEYSHSSAPEVFLAAASQRTSRIRLGTGITLMPPGFNQPARVAERIATLDLVSGGRVEFGTGEASSRMELEGYGVPLDEKRAMWLEATEQVANMMAMDPYPGYEGRYFSMPCRNVVPKPVQRPHPRMWMACSNRDAIRMAAHLGIGALTFVQVEPEVAKEWIDDYYEIIRTECVPIGHVVNARVALTVPLSLAADEESARERGLDGRLFFQKAMAHYYVDGEHQPGRVNLWDQFQSIRDRLAMNAPKGQPSGIGTPAQAAELMRIYSNAGADHVLFMVQAGKNRHEDICASLEMFAERVMPEFHAEEPQREARREAELAPQIAAALARKQFMPTPTDDEIATYAAYKREIVETGPAVSGQLRPDSWQVGLQRAMESAGLGSKDSSAE